MISHNAEFYEALCPEKWILGEGDEEEEEGDIGSFEWRGVIEYDCWCDTDDGDVTYYNVNSHQHQIFNIHHQHTHHYHHHHPCMYVLLSPSPSFYCFLESGRLTVMGAEWMEEVEKARKKAEKLGIHLLDDDDHWLVLVDNDHWLVYIAWLIDHWWALIYWLMIEMLIDMCVPSSFNVVVILSLITATFTHLMTIYVTTQPSVLWTMIRRRRRKMPSETPSLKVLLSLFVLCLRRYCDCNCDTKCN